MEPALDAAGKPVTVQIDTRHNSLLAKVWLMHVGRVDLYLLDCNVEGNRPEDRELTSRLYGGDERIRIRQELVLGIGGVRALRALGITPGVYHLNEGHSAFAPLEVIRERMQDDGLSFERGAADGGQPDGLHHPHAGAGRARSFHRRHGRRASRAASRRAGNPHEQLMGLGRVDPHNHQETVLHDGAGPEGVAQGQFGQPVARPHHAPHVGSSVALARGGGDPHRAHHQRRAHPQLAGLANAAAVRPPFPRRLDLRHGRAGSLAEHPPRGPRRTVGDA